MRPELYPILDELVSDGLVTKTQQYHRHVPDDAWYLPVGCYNVWKESNPIKGLHFLRVYLGIKEDSEILDPKVVKNPEMVKEYLSWLKTNQKGLIFIEELKTVDLLETDKSDILSNQDIEWIKGKSWYENNLSINKCIEESDIGNETSDKRISLLSELSGLYKQKINKTSGSEREKNEKEMQDNLVALEKEKADKIIRAKVRHWLTNQNKKKKIQSLI
jgi:hypothetical protein